MQLVEQTEKSSASVPPKSDSSSSIAIEKARQWAAQDPNDTTASFIERLIQNEAANSNKDELEAIFPANNQRIAFGTAGLRSCMKPGPLHMNDLVVVQAAQGISRYCQETADCKGVVIGYDHRANPALDLSSKSFALYTALVFLEAGYEDVLLLDGFVATPIVPFTLINESKKNSKNYIGIMITASHNPKQDAGYKVYWKDGCQIRSPIDSGMATSIENNLKPWTDYGKRLKELKESDSKNSTCLGLSNPERTKETIDAYYNVIKSSGLVTGQAKLLSTKLPQDPPQFCYSAMHGVGFKFSKQCFEDAFGLPPFSSVKAQQEADFTFPTVPFPNPEEKGALDLAKEFASSVNCDVVLANDPDADRLAVAERDRNTGEWTVFTGDQIGVMLGHWLFTQIGKKDTTGRTMAMCASTVSSKMLAEIARVEGFHFEDTLTGFKWIGSRAAELNTNEEYRTLFCYEEAIGFCCGDVVFDKDGVTALSVFAELAIWVYSQSPSHNIKNHLQSLYDKYGEFVSNNGYYFLQNTSVVKTILEKVTNHGKFDTLDTVGPYKVEAIRYLGEPGYDSSQSDKKPILPTSASSPMLSLWFTNGCVAQFRASGTEPKFKYYIELKGQPGISREQVDQDLQEMSEIILEILLEPSKNGLQKPKSNL